MNITHLLLTAALLTVPLGYAQDESVPAETESTNKASAKSSLPSEVLKDVNSGNFAELQKSLEQMLTEKADKTPLSKLMQNPEYLHLLSIHELIRVTGAENIKFVFDKSPQDKAFIKYFLNDPEWLELYLGAGLIPENSPKGLEVLSDIWNAEKKKGNFRRYRSLATGIASVFTAGPFVDKLKRKPDQCQPVRRFQIFRNLHEKDRLQPNFLKLRPWEIRFVTGLHWDDRSYEWLNEHINLPPRRYVDAFNAAPYRATNYFGDSIQAPLYYVPWRTVNGEAENTQVIGGVCGGLSHFGVMSAQAHGFPAYPVGQPGHCAYGVRVKRGEWKGGFGGPDGGMHNYIFGEQAPTSYLLMEEVFKDDDKIDQAYRWAAQARLDEAAGLKDDAIKDWQEALKQSPLHPFFRTELQRLLGDKDSMKAFDWFAYAQDALSHYDGNGFAAVNILKDVQSRFLSELSKENKIAWFRAVHEKIAGTPNSWSMKLDPILDEQSKYLSGAEQPDFLETVLSVHLNHGDGVNFGQALEWAVRNFVTSGREDIFAKAFEKVAKNSAKVSATAKSGSEQVPDSKKLQEAYGKAIFATEASRSMPAFQALSKAAAAYGDSVSANPTYKTKIPSGWKLISPDNCLVRCSTTSNWDQPWRHLNMLKPCGGEQHTDRESNPNVIVELQSPIDLAGVLVTKRDGNEERMKKMRVSTSVDGATWFPLSETENMPKEWLVESPDGKKAKYIKVEALNSSPEFMHLRHILIYQK